MTKLTIVGSYVVLAGVVGWLANSTVLRGAERTAERILDGLVDALTARTAQEQAPRPWRRPHRRRRCA